VDLGWFGCGKSHFLKVLSYLLRNAFHSFQGNSRHAVEFFEEKIEDAMMLADVKRAVASKTDVILFNIDSKADPRAGREAILGVFLKVLNELQGYDGDHPHIAHMERHLDSRGKLAEFHAAYQELTGDDWVDQARCLRIQPGSSGPSPVDDLGAESRILHQVDRQCRDQFCPERRELLQMGAGVPGRQRPGPPLGIPGRRDRPVHRLGRPFDAQPSDHRRRPGHRL
jgi:hypothetical protein